MNIESLDDLDRWHDAFLSAHRRDRTHTDGFWLCVSEFLDAGAELGAWLWAWEDRRAAQVKLDYWSHYLYRAKGIDHHRLLAKFDEHAPGGFVPIKCVELPQLPGQWPVSVELWPLINSKVYVCGEVVRSIHLCQV